jgi:hypothetical protein
LDLFGLLVNHFFNWSVKFPVNIITYGTGAKFYVFDPIFEGKSKKQLRYKEYKYLQVIVFFLFLTFLWQFPYEFLFVYFSSLHGLPKCIAPHWITIALVFPWRGPTIHHRRHLDCKFLICTECNYWNFKCWRRWTWTNNQIQQ